MPMPPPEDAGKTGGRLRGEDVRAYMESFADRFLKSNIHYDTEVVKIRREPVKSSDNQANQNGGVDASAEGATRWVVDTRDTQTGVQSQRTYDRLVLCTGVSTSCSAFAPFFLMLTISRDAASLSSLRYSHQELPKSTASAAQSFIQVSLVQRPTT